jgi:hypothetical protein
VSQQKENIIIKKGFWASNFFVFVGAFLIIYGIYILFQENSIGRFLIPAGTFVFLPQKGIEIDPKFKTIKNFVSFFGLRIGFKKTIKDYTSTSLLSVKRKFSFFDMQGNLPTNREVVFSRFQTFQVVLLTKNHRRKLIVKEFKSVENAKTLINVLTESGTFSHEKYSPKISQTSKQKRYR